MASNGSHKTSSTIENSQWMGRGSQTQHSNAPLQSGSIDLVAPLRDNGHDDDDLLGEPSQVDIPPESFPEDQRFKQPETPAAGKRDGQGMADSHSGAWTTPRLPANPFAAQAGPRSGSLNPTQAFNMTQAPTSPMLPVVPSEGVERPSPAGDFGVARVAANIPSDMVSEKPSPNLLNGAHRSTSDPITSPTVPRKPLTRSITGPFTEYRPMKESQEKRRRRENRYRAREPSAELDPLDAEFEQSSRVVPDSVLGKRSRGDRAHFNRKPAAPRPSSSSGRVQAPKSYSSPPVPARPHTSPIAVSSDESSTNSSEEETEREDRVVDSDADLPDELGEENKENIDVKKNTVQVASTTPVRCGSQRLSMPRSGSRVSPRHPSPESSPDELAEESPSKRLKSTPGRQSQPVTIADSQTSQSQLRKRPRNNAQRLNGSSGESRKLVLQTQPSPKAPTNSQPRRSQRTLTPPPSSGKIEAASSLRPRRSPRHQGLSPPKQIVESIPSSPPAPKVTTKATESSSREEDASEPQLPKEPVVSSQTNRSNGFRKPASREVQASSNPERVGQRRSFNVADQTPLKQKHPPSTIPETECPSRFDSRGHSLVASSKDKIGGQTSLESVQDHSEEQANSARGSNGFATAPTHLSRTSTTNKTQQRADVSQEIAGRTQKPGPTPLGVIAGPLSQENEESSFDPNDFNLVTEQDDHFEAEFGKYSDDRSATGQPAKKRRRLDKRPILPDHVSSDQPCAPSSICAAPPGEPELSIHKDRRPVSVVENDTSSSTAQRHARLGSSIGARASQKLDGQSSMPTPSDSQLSSSPIPQSTSPVEGSVPTLSGHAPHDEPCESSPIPAGPSMTRRKSRPSRLQESSLASGESQSAGAAHAEDSTISVPCPTRVFAQFKGSPAGYYPATCLGISNEHDPRSKFRVRFDDGTEGDVGESQVKRLQLQPGELVKVFRSGMRANTYVVTQLVKKFGNNRRKERLEAFPATDVEGHQGVRVKLKQASKGKEEEQEVAIAEIYLTISMWTPFKGELYEHPMESVNGITAGSELSSRPETPATPTNMLRRRQKQSARISMNQSLSGMPRPALRSESNIFAGLVFAFTAIADPETRRETEGLIIKHGGKLLQGDQGFEALFDVPPPTKLPTSPGSTSSPAPATSSVASTPASTPTSASSKFAIDRFALKRSCDGAVAAVLLSDNYSRNAKFFQALALGLPCLAVRWIKDCVSRRELVSWPPYLLASGESAYLGGAVCSRALPLPPPHGANADPNDAHVAAPPSLRRTIAARPAWLAGRGVLLVGGGKMHAYVFLAHALGAARVAVARSCEAARAALRTGGAGGAWDWVCVHEDEKAAGGGGGAAGRKRKRGRGESGESGGAPDEDGFGLKGLGGAKVVGTEFVVQSLILGRLLEDLGE